MLLRFLYSGMVGGDCCLWLVQLCWPALGGWRLLCAPLVVSGSSSCLLIYSSPSRLFVTHIHFAYILTPTDAAASHCLPRFVHVR